MKEDYYIFSVVKLLFIYVIFIELAVLKLFVSPANLREYITAITSFRVYLGQIVSSIILMGVGALIMLKKL